MMTMNWFRQAYYGYRGLFGWLTWPSYISTVVFRPAFNMAIYALVGKFALSPEAAAPFLVGMSAYQIPFILLGGITNCMSRDRWLGTLPFLFLSRGSRSVAYFAKGVCHFPNAVLAVSIVLLAAWAFLGLDISRLDWATLAVSVVVLILSSTSAALCVGNLGIVINDWATAYGAFAGLMLAFTGVIIPVSSLPSPLPLISYGLPLTHGLAAFRGAFAGADLSAVAGSLLLEALVGFGYAVAGVALFRFMEREAKRRGVLETPGTS